MDGSNSLEGRVEICQNNVWFTLKVCNYNSLDTAYARVVCRQLGFSTAGEL